MDEIFDIIAPLLFAALSMFGIIVGKKKKEVGQSNRSEAPETVADDIPMSRFRVRDVNAPLPEEGVSMVNQGNETVVETDSPKIRGKEAIDKRKLIIYSEIMKPKFDE